MENTTNEILDEVKGETEKILQIIKQASAVSKEGTPGSKEKARDIMGEAQEICENLKNRLNSFLE